jgi:hypothetical protein
MNAFLERLSAIWKPHAGQLEFLMCEAKFKVLACGRRWGKTDACAVAILASLFQPIPRKHVILAPTLDQASLVFDRTVELFQELALAEERPCQPELRRTPYPRLAWNGHRVSARSGHLSRSLRGNEATDIVVDEAAYVPEELVAEVALPMLATNGGTITLISTPFGMNHFWRFFRMGAERLNGVWSRKAPTSENPHIAKGFLEVQRELISDRAFRVEYEAEFLDGADRVFRAKAIEACLVSELAKAPEPPYFVGVDWARRLDFTAAAVVSGFRQKATLVELRRFRADSWTDSVAAVADIARRYPRASVLCDSTGLGDPLSEMLQQSLGRKVGLLGFTTASKQELVNRLAWMIENRALEMLPHPDLIREMQHYESSETGSGRLRFGAPSGMHDDLVTALALACRQLPDRYSLKLGLGARRTFPS